MDAYSYPYSPDFDMFETEVNYAQPTFDHWTSAQSSCNAFESLSPSSFMAPNYHSSQQQLPSPESISYYPRPSSSCLTLDIMLEDTFSQPYPAVFDLGYGGFYNSHESYGMLGTAVSSYQVQLEPHQWACAQPELGKPPLPSSSADFPYQRPSSPSDSRWEAVQHPGRYVHTPSDFSESPFTPTDPNSGYQLSHKEILQEPASPTPHITTSLQIKPSVLEIQQPRPVRPIRIDSMAQLATLEAACARDRCH